MNDGARQSEERKREIKAAAAQLRAVLEEMEQSLQVRSGLQSETGNEKRGD